MARCSLSLSLSCLGPTELTRTMDAGRRCRSLIRNLQFFSRWSGYFQCDGIPSLTTERSQVSGKFFATSSRSTFNASRLSEGTLSADGVVRWYVDSTTTSPATGELTSPLMYQRAPRCFF
jgi:hypothetical protein